MSRVKSLAAAVLLTLSAAPAAADPRDLVETATTMGTFTKLLQAAEGAGLIDTLKAPGPLTLFAPTDTAFAKLDAEFTAYLLKPENKDELAALIRKHVVAGKLTAQQLQAASEPLDTLASSPLAVEARDGLRIGNAKVTTPDIAASNGIIHAIDAVIEPKL